MGNQRGACRPGECARRSHEEQHTINGINAVRPVQAGAREQEQCRSGKHLQPIANQDDLPPVEAIGHVPSRQQENQPRQKQRQSGKAQIESAVSNGVDLPRDSDRLRFGAQDDHHTRQLISREIAGGKCFHASRGRLGGKVLHVQLLGYIVGPSAGCPRRPRELGEVTAEL